MEECELEGSTPRQRERHAVNMLLAAMTGEGTYRIDHEPSGKPILQSAGDKALGYNQISISHTHGYAAIILSCDTPVGIDIEYCSDRVNRIASRFIHPNEKAETTLQKLLLWSAKETVYKLYSEDKLEFFDMRLTSLCDGMMTIEQRKRKTVVDVCFEATDNYVLTYAIGESQA
jgi:phosphopantetheinyl transferase